MEMALVQNVLTHVLRCVCIVLYVWNKPHLSSHLNRNWKRRKWRKNLDINIGVSVEFFFCFFFSHFSFYFVTMHLHVKILKVCWKKYPKRKLVKKKMVLMERKREQLKQRTRVFYFGSIWEMDSELFLSQNIKSK